MAQPLDLNTEASIDAVRNEVLGSSRQLVDTGGNSMTPITELEIARERANTWKGIEGLDIGAAIVREKFLFNDGTNWARRKGYIREDQNGTEDSIFNKYIGFKFGEAYKADPNFYSYDPQVRAKLTAGLPESYHHYFDDTTSLAQAEEVGRQLHQHLGDVKVLGSMASEGTWAPKVGSVLLSLGDPAQVALAFASYGTSLAYGAVRAARLAKTISAVNKAEALIAPTVARAEPALGAATASIGGRTEPVLGNIAGNANKAVVGVPSAFDLAKGGTQAAVAAESAGTAVATRGGVPATIEAAGGSAPIGIERGTVIEGEFSRVTEEAALKQLGVKSYPLVSYEAKAGSASVGAEIATEAAAVVAPVVAKSAGSVISKAIPGIIEGAAQNVTYEALKNNLDFEDNEGAAAYLAAALWGAAFSAPFAMAGAGSDALARFTASRESRVLDMLREEKLHPELTNEPVHIQARHEHAQIVATALKAETQAHGIPNTYEEHAASFKAGSVGSAQVGDVGQGYQVGPKGEGRAAELANAYIDNKINKARLDWFWQVNKYANPYTQRLNGLLVKDPVAGSRAYAQGRTATEDKYLYQRRNAGTFHAIGRKSVREAAKLGGWGWNAKRVNTDQFYKDAGRLARGDKSVLGEVRNIPITKQLQETADAATKHVYNDLAVEAKRHGVDGSDTLQPSDSFVNRVWDQDSIRNAVKRHGKDAAAKLLAGSFAIKRGAKVDMGVAHNLLSAIRRLEHDSALEHVFSMGARDAKLLREELAKAGLNPGEVSAVVDTMFESRANGTSPDAANLKHRFELDENHAVQLPDGSFLRVSDLLENDLRVLVDRYVNRMGGHIALAKKGIKNDADFERIVKQADDWFAENQDKIGVSAEQHKQAIQMLRDSKAYLTGAPMSTFVFNKVSRMLTAMRSYTRSTMLGELGLAALSEAKNALSLATLKSALRDMPSLLGYIQAARKGDFSKLSSLAQVTQHMTGIGSERAASYSRQSLITDNTYSKELTRWENMTRGASHSIDIASGNAAITAATRHMAATVHAQKYIDVSLGKKSEAMAGRIKARAVGQGIDHDAFDSVMADLKAHTEVNKHSGAGESIDYESWKKANPDTYDSFVTAVMRDARDGVQDLDLGETAAFTHTPIGQFFGELRSFSLGAHSKQFVKGLHYRDSITATQWTMSFIGEAMTYSLQTAINYAQSPEELEKRLTLDAISRSAVSRMNVLGFLPMLIDTPAEMFLGHPILNPGGTNNTGNRNFLVTPSMAVAGKALTALKSAGQALSPAEAAVVTRKEAYDSTGFLPFSNFWGVRNLRNMFADEFPASEPQPQKQ